MATRRTINFTPSFNLENAHASPVVGLDEAGCGAWVGPVVAGAAFIAKDCDTTLLALLNDSKRLTPKTREELFDILQKKSDMFKIASGIAGLEEIEKLNIRNASLLAMCRAYENLGIHAQMALVDGTGEPKLPCPIKTCVKGDQRSYSIAAASIVAKVTRDRLMQRLSQEFPAYGWNKNVGYGTAAHQAALAKYGVTPYHRRTYRPIKEILEQLELQPHPYKV